MTMNHQESNAVLTIAAVAMFVLVIANLFWLR
jgi:hypothetical protein